MTAKPGWSRSSKNRWPDVADCPADKSVGSSRPSDSGEAADRPIGSTGARRRGPTPCARTGHPSAEEDDGWIVRLFESSGTPCTARVALPLADAEWELAIGAWEVRTFKVRSWQVEEVDLTEAAAG